MKKISSKDFRIGANEPVDLSDRPTRMAPYFDSRQDYQDILQKHVEGLARRQGLHAASARYALLIIFQGIDCAGKDGAICHVMSGVNPEGCEVFGFKQPSVEELKHDFLWRTTCRLPERGRIGLFNRSYYEEVLVTRVHPAILDTQALPRDARDAKHFWRDRYRSINEFEGHLDRNGTRIIKIFLHLSKQEQAKRFLERIKSPDKNWKFSTADLHEREFWAAYVKVYSQCMTATSTAHAPWYCVPADDKENARLIVSQIVLDVFDDLRMAYPERTAAEMAQLDSIARELEDASSAG